MQNEMFDSLDEWDEEEPYYDWDDPDWREDWDEVDGSGKVFSEGCKICCVDTSRE